MLVRIQPYWKYDFAKYRHLYTAMFSSKELASLSFLTGDAERQWHIQQFLRAFG